MKTRARGFWVALAIPTLLGASAAGAADVAILKSSDVPAWRAATEALRRVTAAHNVVEHDLRGDRAEAERVLQGLKGKATILVALGPLAAQAAREVLPEAPLVFAMIQDPVRLGLAGPNVTGVSFSIPIRNQLAAFRLVNPRGVRIGVLYNEENVGRLVQEAQKAASLVRLALVPRSITSDKELPQALRSLLSGADAVDALWMPPDPMIMGDEARRYLLTETLKSGKPVYAFSSALVGEGALVSNGPSLTSIGEQAGELVNRIAAGDKGKIEIVVPQAELVINTKVAGRLKIEIPQDALGAANKKL